MPPKRRGAGFDQFHDLTRREWSRAELVPQCRQHGGGRGRFVVVALAGVEQGKAINAFADQRCRMLDWPAAQRPPILEPGLRHLACGPVLAAVDEDGVKAAQNLATVLRRPADRVGMGEFAVFGVGPVDVDDDRGSCGLSYRPSGPMLLPVKI